MSKLKHECSFCGTPTNFKDSDEAYCIDCYCKLRNSSHVHLNHPQITPMPNINPVPDIGRGVTPPYIGGTRIIC